MRTLLKQDLAILRLREADGTLTDEEARTLVNAEAAEEEALANLTGPTAIDPVTLKPVQTQLYLYDPSAFGGDGRVAIAVGDLDTADNVSVQVPGMDTDGGSIGTEAERALNVYSASRWADRLHGLPGLDRVQRAR
ncbi:MAG: alpha/beta hydrolase [Pseudonocardiaceae bacterium]